MENLPIELVQTISDILDYVDQLNFKSVNRGFYDSISIKQQLPYILTLGRYHESNSSDYSYYRIIPMDCFRLDKYYSIVQKYLKYKDLWDYSVYVLNPNKYSKKPKITDFNEFDYWVSYYKDLDNYNSCDKDYGKAYRISTIDITLEDSGKIFVYYESNDINAGYVPFNMRTFVQKCIDKLNKYI